jgi:hypothetical protein
MSYSFPKLKTLRILVHPYHCQAGQTSFRRVDRFYRRVIKDCARYPASHFVFVPQSNGLAQNQPFGSYSHTPERQLWEFINQTYLPQPNRVTFEGSSALGNLGDLKQRGHVDIAKYLLTDHANTYFASDLSATLVEKPESALFCHHEIRRGKRRFWFFSLGPEFQKILQRILPREQEIEQINVWRRIFRRFVPKERNEISLIANGEILPYCVLDQAATICVGLGLPIQNLVLDPSQYEGTNWDGEYNGFKTPQEYFSMRSQPQIKTF